MMLHRHFETEGEKEELTKLEDVRGESEIFPPEPKKGKKKQ